MKLLSQPRKVYQEHLYGKADLLDPENCTQSKLILIYPKTDLPKNCKERLGDFLEDWVNQRDLSFPRTSRIGGSLRLAKGLIYPNFYLFSSNCFKKLNLSL